MPKGLKKILMIAGASGILFLLLVLATMCGSNTLMTGNDLQQLSNIVQKEIRNEIVSIKTTEEENSDQKEWEIITGKPLDSGLLASNNLPLGYYRKMSFTFNENYQFSDKRINEISLMLMSNKDMTFKLKILFNENNYFEQEVTLKANEKTLVMFGVYSSMKNMTTIDFINATEIKSKNDIVQWSMYDIQVSFDN